VFLPPSYIIEDETLREGILIRIIDNIWSDWKNNTYFLPLLAALVIADERGINWMVSGDKLKQIFD